jgi:hypothetical protein
MRHSVPPDRIRSVYNLVSVKQNTVLCAFEVRLLNSAEQYAQRKGDNKNLTKRKTRSEMLQNTIYITYQKSHSLTNLKLYD